MGENTLNKTYLLVYLTFEKSKVKYIVLFIALSLYWILKYSETCSIQHALEENFCWNRRDNTMKLITQVLNERDFIVYEYKMILPATLITRSGLLLALADWAWFAKGCRSCPPSVSKNYQHVITQQNWFTWTSQIPYQVN